MVTVRDDLSLSRIELTVLARLSVETKTPPGAPDLGRAVREIALPKESEARTRALALEALEALRGRGLVTKPARVRKGQLGPRDLTEEGARSLRAALGLARTPLWKEVRSAHLPAFVLGLKPGSDTAKKALKDADSISVAWVRKQLRIDGQSTLVALCDALIAEELRLPNGINEITAIRAHVLARRLGMKPKDDPAQVAWQVVEDTLHPSSEEKDELTRVLCHHWAQQADSALAQAGPRVVPASQASSSPQVIGKPAQDGEASLSITGEALLEAMREHLPRVGAEGRFGDEKVFVSAIWRSIEHDKRLSALSFDRFKHWLVTANRAGTVVLVRADLINAMDAKLVAESEIRDQGALFHFVLDQRSSTASAGKGTHVR